MSNNSIAIGSQGLLFNQNNHNNTIILNSLSSNKKLNVLSFLCRIIRMAWW